MSRLLPSGRAARCLLMAAGMMNHDTIRSFTPLTIALGAVLAAGCGGTEDDTSIVEISSTETAALDVDQTILIDLEGPSRYVFDNEDGLLDFSRIELLFSGVPQGVAMDAWLDTVELPKDPRDGGRFELDASIAQEAPELHGDVGQTVQGLRMFFCTRMRICANINGRRTCVSGTQCYTCRPEGDCAPLVPTLSVR